MSAWRLILAIYFLFAGITATTEVMPPAPAHYFNDYANAVSPATAQQLNDKLAQFERDTSNQFVVAIYPKMESDSSVEDYTFRVAQSWKVGQKLKNNGGVLFVFVQDHKLFIQVGYGLEGALPDALCKRIINTEITPRFKQGDFNGGLTAGVDAVIAATKGEYRGTGSTVYQTNNSGHPQNIVPVLALIIFGLVILATILKSFARAYAYSNYTSSGYHHGMWYWLLYSMMANNSSSYQTRNDTWYSGGSSSSSGGFFGGGGGGGGGGFSGGGGSFGGGGAGGSW